MATEKGTESGSPLNEVMDDIGENSFSGLRRAIETRTGTSTTLSKPSDVHEFSFLSGVW